MLFNLKFQNIFTLSTHEEIESIILKELGIADQKRFGINNSHEYAIMHFIIK